MRYEKVMRFTAIAAGVVGGMLLVGYVGFLWLLGSVDLGHPEPPSPTPIQTPTSGPTWTPTPWNMAPKPSGFRVTGVTETTVSLSWDSIPDAHEYLLERAEALTEYSFEGKALTSDADHTDSGMDPGKTYYFRVHARGDGTRYLDTFGTPSVIVGITTLPDDTTTLPLEDEAR